MAVGRARQPRRDWFMIQILLFLCLIWFCSTLFMIKLYRHLEAASPQFGHFATVLTYSVSPSNGVRSTNEDVQLQEQSNQALQRKYPIPTLCLTNEFNAQLEASCDLLLSSQVDTHMSRGWFYSPHWLTSFQELCSEMRNIVLPVFERTYADVLYIMPCAKRGRASSKRRARIRSEVNYVHQIVEDAGFIFKIIDLKCGMNGRIPYCGEPCKRSKIILVFDDDTGHEIPVFLPLEYGAIPAFFAKRSYQWMEDLQLRSNALIELRQYQSLHEFVQRGILYSLLHNSSNMESMQRGQVFRNAMGMQEFASFWQHPMYSLQEWSHGIFQRGWFNSKVPYWNPMIQFLQRSARFFSLHDRHEIRVCEPSESVPSDKSELQKLFSHVFNSREVMRISNCSDADLVIDWRFTRTPATISKNPVLRAPAKHVLFTTHKKYRPGERGDLYAKNSESALRRLNGVHFLRFEDQHPAIRTNEYGYPYLKDMYLEAMRLIPDAATYTFFNYDIIFNSSFVETIEAALVAASEHVISDRFLIVGRRTNVNWTMDMLVDDPSFNFSRITRDLGEVFDADAIDYFTCSRRLWDWETIPPFVIGRIAYDNWILNKAVAMFPEVSVVEASETSPVIHQTTPSIGNYQGHQGKNDSDILYNARLGAKNWKRGIISYAGYHSIWNMYGSVSIRRRVPWRTLSPTTLPTQDSEKITPSPTVGLFITENVF